MKFPSSHIWSVLLDYTCCILRVQHKTEEEKLMKNTTVHHRKKVVRYRTAHRYPNAADRNYYLDRLSDIILTAATACGAVTIIAYLFTMA